MSLFYFMSLLTAANVSSTYVSVSYRSTYVSVSSALQRVAYEALNFGVRMILNNCIFRLLNFGWISSVGMTIWLYIQLLISDVNTRGGYLNAIVMESAMGI